MSDSFIQVNQPVTVGVKLKSFVVPDGIGNDVQIEAIAPVDPVTGDPIVANLAAPADFGPAAPEVTVSSLVASLVAPASDRISIALQNTGNENVRIGPPSVAVNSGLRLLPNGVITLFAPFIVQGPIYAIAEEGTSTVSCLEVFQ